MMTMACAHGMYTCVSKSHTPVAP